MGKSFSGLLFAQSLQKSAKKIKGLWMFLQCAWCCMQSRRAPCIVFHLEWGKLHHRLCYRETWAVFSFSGKSGSCVRYLSIRIHIAQADTHDQEKIHYPNWLLYWQYNRVVITWCNFGNQCLQSCHELIQYRSTHIPPDTVICILDCVLRQFIMTFSMFIITFISTMAFVRDQKVLLTFQY